MDIYVIGNEIKSVVLQANGAQIDYDLWDKVQARELRLKFLQAAAEMGPDDALSEKIYKLIEEA